MSNQRLFMGGTVRDENGKLQIAPMKLPDFMKIDSASKKKTDQQPRITRKYIPIEPLVLPDFMKLDSATKNKTDQQPRNTRKYIHIEPLGSWPDLEFSPVSKKRKIEKPVRKELFKVPSATKSKPEKRRSLTRPFRKLSSLNKKGTPRKSFLPSADQSLLIDIDEAEELVSKSSVIKKDIKTVLLPKNTISDTSDNNGTTPEKTKLENQSFNTGESDDIEFLQLEKVMSEKENYPESPLSSVCSLLQNTNINRSGGGKVKSKSQEILAEIKILVKQDQEQLELVKQQIRSYELQHQILLDRIDEFLKADDSSKNNQNRRSDRIALRNSVKKNKFTVSPAITRSVDLRKTTLNKNLTKNLENDVGSPRMRRAVNMYNTFRSDCGVLCTPKTDRSTIDVVEASVKRSLSRRIQKQCLMLQDTPIKH